MTDTIVKAVAAVKATSDDGNGSFEVILSTPTADRDGEEVLPEEWDDLPEHVTFDIDHGMSVATTVGSGAPALDEDGRLVVRGTYASTDLAQQTRALVNEGHIRTTSVAFLRKSSTTKDGKQTVRRELLNGAFVAVPANPEALVVTSKSAAEAVEAATGQATKATVVKAIAGSYEERQQAVYEAVARLYDDWHSWAYLVGTDDDVAVWRVWSDDDDLAGTWRATYTIDAAHAVTLGTPEKVRVVEVVTEIPPPTTEDSPGSPAIKAGEHGETEAPGAGSADDAEAIAKALAVVRANQVAALTA